MLWYLAAVGVGIGGVSAYDHLAREHRYPFSGDSAVYLEMAETLRSGELPTAVSHWGVGPVAGAISANLFPPGFPLLVAGLAFATGDVKTAAVLPGRVAAAGLPLAMMLAFRGLLPAAALLLVGTLVLASPAVVRWHFMAYSDLPLLLVAIVAMGLLCMRDGRTRSSLVASGALAGIAYWLRNAAVALLFAGAFALGLRWRRERFAREAGRDLLAWCGAAAVPVLALIAYNLVAIGAAQPYPAPDASGQIANILPPLVATQLLDLGLPRALAWLAQQWPLLVYATVVLGLIALCLRVERRLSLAVLALSVYVVAGTTLLLAFHVLYAGAEAVELRFVMQYSWTLLLLAGIAIFHGRWRFAPAIAVVAAVTLVAYRAWVLVTRDVPRMTAVVEDQRTMADDLRLLDAVRRLPAEAFVASNQAYVFRIETGRDVRQYDMIQSQDGLSDLRDGLVRLAGAIDERHPLYYVLTCHQSARVLTPCSAFAWRTRNVEGWRLIGTYQDYAAIWERTGQLP
jgi:hypothetical protein